MWSMVSEVSLLHVGRVDRAERFMSGLPGGREKALLLPDFLFFVKVKSRP